MTLGLRLLDRLVMKIEVAGKVIEAMQAAAEDEYPREACGILLGEGGRILVFRKTRNTHPSPETHFEIDPQMLIDAHRDERGGGPKVLGYFHSHPQGAPQPSSTDQEMAAGDESIWAILGEGEIHLFRDKIDGFQTLSYEVIDV